MVKKRSRKEKRRRKRRVLHGNILRSGGALLAFPIEVSAREESLNGIGANLRRL